MGEVSVLPTLVIVHASGRLIEPEKIAKVLAFLASPLSAAINGAAICVEGSLINSLT